MIIIQPDPVLSFFQFDHKFFFSGSLPVREGPAAGVVEVGIYRLIFVCLDGKILVISTGIQNTEDISPIFRNHHIVKYQRIFSADTNCSWHTIFFYDFSTSGKILFFHHITKRTERIIVNQLHFPDSRSPASCPFQLQRKAAFFQ